MDGKAPLGWRAMKLGEIAHVLMGQSPSSVFVNEEGLGLPFIQGNAEFGYRHPKPAKWCSQPAKVAREGDILLSVRAPVGALNMADQDLAIGRGLSAIRLKDGAQDFGWYALNLAVGQLGRTAQGSTFTAVGRKEVGSLKLLLPPLAEQRKIAGILSSVDDAVEKTQAVIRQVQVVRRGLMQQLLTRGIPGRHTRFKHTEVGEIPEEWEVVRLGEVASVVSGFALGPARRPSKYPRPYLTVANVQVGRIEVSEPRFMEVAPEEYEGRKIQVGDVVIVEGHAQLSELGRAAIATASVESFTFQNHLFRVRPDAGRCDPLFLCSFINGPRGRAYFQSFGGTTSGLNTVSTANVSGMPIPVPQLEEQRTIARLISVLEGRLSIERDNLTHHQRVKAALMQVLLTGEVRVKVKEAR